MITPNVVLWIAAVFIATGILLSAMERREAGLIEALKEFVTRHIQREDAKKRASSDDSGGGNGSGQG